MESLKTTLSTFESAAVNPHQPHQSVPSPELIPIGSGHVLAVEHNILQFALIRTILLQVIRAVNFSST